MSYIIPSGLVIDLSASSRSVVIGSKVDMPSFLQAPVVRMLMAAPRSTNVFRNDQPEICTVTMGFLGSSYFTGGSLPSNKSDSAPTTRTVATTFVFFTCFFPHISLIFFV